MDSEYKFLHGAIEKRADFIAEEQHKSAFRLLNGFTENMPVLTIDIFGRTAVLHEEGRSRLDLDFVSGIANELTNALPWIQNVLFKRRHARNTTEKNGISLFSAGPVDTEIVENGVHYAIDLQLNQDNSFYCDTRHLRQYLYKNCAGKSVLNTFAYTGSYSIAALAGGATEVTQIDLSERFQGLTARSAKLNGIEPGKLNTIVDNFFTTTSKMRRERQLFDVVILDPPYFSQTPKGLIDLVRLPVAPVKKIQPLVRDGGIIIYVNNALQLTGEAYLAELDKICDGTYLTRGEIIPVGEDFTVGAETLKYSPAPFPHPTKIQILKVHRKA